MVANKLFLILLLVLSGCATTDPQIRVVTEKVEIPVAVPCKEEIPDEPDFCFVKLNDNADIFDQVKCLLSDRKLSIGYEGVLTTKLKACK